MHLATTELVLSSYHKLPVVYLQLDARLSCGHSMDGSLMGTNRETADVPRSLACPMFQSTSDEYQIAFPSKDVQYR